MPLLFIYFNYRRKVKRYRKVFVKTLIKNGIGKDMALKISTNLRILRASDFFRFAAYEKIGYNK